MKIGYLLKRQDTNIVWMNNSDYLISTTYRTLNYFKIVKISSRQNDILGNNFVILSFRKKMELELESNLFQKLGEFFTPLCFKLMQLHLSLSQRNLNVNRWKVES